MDHEHAESVSPTYFELQPVQIPQMLSPPPVPPSTGHQALTQQSSTPQLAVDIVYS
jgi:hypothetical protein